MEVLGIVAIVFFVLLYLGVLAFAVVGYIFGSKGVYAIAVRRGIKNPWMAWVPIVSNWTLGSISDQYATRKYGQDPNLRKKLLIWSIITQSGISVFPVVGNIDISISADSDVFSDFAGTEAGRVITIIFLVVMLMLSLVMLVLSVIQTVYQYKAYYNLYASCRPEKAMLFLMLAIFTPANPFLVYACRNSDEGIPPEQAE